ncbi:MAG: type II toxin-antitoxin system RelE family toxin [Elusimicrobiota bacterium]
MASYSVFLKRTAEKELRALPRADIERVVRRIRSPAAEPRPAGCEKLSGEEKFRIRQGNWRVVYEVDDAAGRVEVVKIGHRREVYR